MKDAIPYAQDATRKRHFKKLLKFIRLIDFLFNDTKYHLIINSLQILDKRFKRLYESYVNGWVDNPLITTIVVNLNGKISYENKKFHRPTGISSIYGLFRGSFRSKC